MIAQEIFSPLTAYLLSVDFRVLQNGSLLIHNIRSEDKGYYLCQATNGIGVGLSKVVYLTVHGQCYVIL